MPSKTLELKMNGENIFVLIPASLVHLAVGAFTNGKRVNIIPVLVDVQLEPLNGVWCSCCHFLYTLCGQCAQDEDAAHFTSSYSEQKINKPWIMHFYTKLSNYPRPAYVHVFLSLIK
jgi:hypothetical protein